MSRVVRRAVREPLLQFLVLGLVLFVGYRGLHRNDARAADLRRIELTADDLRQIRIAWLAQGRTALSPEEMKQLVDARVREEILYREALALGLDKDDAIVRRRMAQKMEFLFEDVAALREPTSDELRTWFGEHAARFTLPPRVTFRHLYFSPDRRGQRVRNDASRALEQLAGAPMDAPRAATLGDPFMLQDFYGDRAPDDIAKAFGPGFARALFATTPGAWAGPIESGYGWHLVWIDSLTPSRTPAFEEVMAEVRTAWTEAQRTAIREKAFQAMRTGYEVVLPEHFDIADATALPPESMAPLAGIASE